MKRKIAGLCAFVALCLCCPAAFALTVGTFDLADFHAAGTKSASRRAAAYTLNDMRELAKSVRRSGAAVLALQGVEGEATMRLFTVAALPGWKYAGNDTSGAGDLYFLWDPQKAALTGQVSLLKAGAVLKDLPLCARFRDAASGKAYTLVNAHLEKRAAPAQMGELHARAKTLPHPVILLGGCDDESLTHPEITLRQLDHGFSCDNDGSNPDFVGFIGLPPEKIGDIRETETRIRRRSSKRRELPEHDIVTVEILD